MRARVVSIGEVQLGSELDVAASIGATTITVSDVEAMDWGDGRQLQIGPASGPQEIVPYSIPAAEDPASDEIDLDETPDAEEGTVALGVALANDYAEDVPVRLYPPTYERMAYCLPEDSYEVIAARVPDKLLTRLLTATRDEGTSETVDIAIVDGIWEVGDVISDYPAADGSYIVPTTLPQAVGPNPPGSGADSALFFTEAWSNPTRVTASDGSYATAIGTSAVATVTAHNTGSRLPGTAADDSAVGTVSWATVNGILGVGGNQAVASGVGTTHYLEATGFGLSVPVGATITGVTVQISHFQGGSRSTSEVTDDTVKLIKGGAVSGSERATDLAWPIQLQTATYGNTGDMWGLSLTPSDVNASDFGVALSVLDGEGHPKFVDSIKIKVSYTTVDTTDKRSNTHFLVASGFGFTIPDDATITGITAAVERHASASSGNDYAADNDVRLLKGGANPTATDNHAKTGRWPTSDAVATYGGDLWGTTWSADEVNDSAFGVFFSANVNNGVTASVDYISVTVHYVEAGG